MVKSFEAFRSLVYPYSGSAPADTARIRASAMDFRVEELLGFEPDGVENHLLLLVRKSERNTHDVVKWLSERTGTSRRDVGFCGLKDRVAVTTQWFSVPLATEQHIPRGLSDGIEVLATAPHSRKLRRGQHSANRFEIVLRSASTPLSFAEISRRFEHACEKGVPNYFGPQRFGRDGENIHNGLAMLRGEFRPRQAHVKGILLSALRSFLFNEILAERVLKQLWNQPLPGDVLFAAGGGVVDIDQQAQDQQSLIERCSAFEIHPSGVLPGPGNTGVSDQAAELESEVLARHSEIATILTDKGPRADRRSLRLCPESVAVKLNSDDSICLQFDLAVGSFATSLLREIVNDVALGLPWCQA